MRVLSIISSLDPARGGTQSGATAMILASQRAGIANVVVAAGNRAGRRRAAAMATPLTEAGARVIQLETLPWPPEHPDRWGLSARQVRWVTRHAAEFDAVHVHGAWGVGLLAGLMSGARARTPVVVTPHESFTDFDIEDSKTPFRRRQKLALKRVYLRLATLFVVTSELERDDSFDAPDLERVRVVPYPVETPAAGDPPSRSEPARPEFRIGFLGRVHPKKNLDQLIEVIADLPRHIRLLVAGDGPEADSLKRHARRIGAEKQVEWLGFVPPERRSEFLSSIDVLAMPSTFESFGMSAAESMLSRVPVIVSERTGIAELIRRHGGGKVIAADAAALAASILELERDRSCLVELGDQARLAILTELRADAIGQRLARAYDDAVALANGHGAAVPANGNGNGDRPS